MMENNMQNPPYLLAGLGNPGREYRNNRHNTGFMVIDQIAEELGLRLTRYESKALFTKGEYSGKRIYLAKPQTFMNLSGQAVSALVRYYKVPLEQLLVIYDDVDLPLGSLRLRGSGGSGGQKGMQSIITSLGSNAFPRLRIGVGRPPGRMDTASYILQDFSVGEKEFVAQVLERAARAALSFIQHGLEDTMNQFNALSFEE